MNQQIDINRVNRNEEEIEIDLLDLFYYYRSNGSSADMSLMAMNKHNTNCLWAESEKKRHNSPLRRDEVIIYDDAQSTIEYLIEVKNPHSY